MKDHSAQHDTGAYRRLGVELTIDFVIMYFVMYTMIESVGHLYLNVNNVYMTLMMVDPMAAVMLVSMRSMFHMKNLNLAIGVAAVVVFAVSFLAMRTQAVVGDRQFLRDDPASLRRNLDVRGGISQRSRDRGIVPRHRGVSEG